jgi:plastocyanin
VALRYGARPMPTRLSSKRLLLVTAVLGLAVLGTACGGDDDGGGKTVTAVNGEVTIVAKDSEWDADRIEVPADDEVTVVVDNQDDGVSHNLNVKDTDFKTKIEKGPKEQRLDVTLEEGTYEYVCDVHANMKGTLVAEEASTPSTTGG